MDKIKNYFLKNFEQVFVFVLLVSVALINYFVPYKLAFLNFYFIPVLLTAYYLDVRRALLGAVLCLIMVSFFFYRDPASFYPGTTNLDIAMNIMTWACFLILSGALVGNLSHKLQEEVQQSQTLHTELSASQASANETNKMLGLSFQAQGMLDLAFDKFRLCPVDEVMKDLLYNLALDFERKRHYPKAVTVYEHIERADPKYRDIQEKKKSLKEASGGGMHGGLGRMIGVTKPTLGRYEIDKELGRGAMGIVYLGRDPKINRKVAIKTMMLDESTVGTQNVKDVKERFFREAESAGTLNHPNIVRIFDAGEEHDLCYIAMEYLDGHNFVPYTTKTSLLPIRHVLEFIAQVADALDSAHAQGIVHRDIKPANIMLLKDGTIRVADFGIARIVASSNTASGTVMGTVAYMSPEQVAGKRVDGRSDLFALGVVLFELLTGSRPFEGGEGIGTILFRIASEPEPEPMQLNPKIPPCASHIVHKALKKNSDERYLRGSQMAADLRACAATCSDAGMVVAAGAGMSGPPTPMPTPTPTPIRSAAPPTPFPSAPPTPLPPPPPRMPPPPAPAAPQTPAPAPLAAEPPTVRAPAEPPTVRSPGEPPTVRSPAEVTIQAASPGDLPQQLGADGPPTQRADDVTQQISPAADPSKPLRWPQS